MAKASLGQKHIINIIRCMNPQSAPSVTDTSYHQVIQTLHLCNIYENVSFDHILKYT